MEKGDFEQKGKNGIFYSLDKKGKKGFISIEALELNQIRPDLNEKAIILRLTLEHFGAEPILIDPNRQFIQIKTDAKTMRITSEISPTDQTPIKILSNYTRIVDLTFRLPHGINFENHLNSLTAEINLKKGAKKVHKTVKFKRTEIEKGINTFHSKSEPDKATTHYGRRSDTFYYY